MTSSPTRPDANTPPKSDGDQTGHTNETAARVKTSRNLTRYLDARRHWQALRTAGHPDTSAKVIEAHNIVLGLYRDLRGSDIGMLKRIDAERKDG